jgi:AAA15 family ATPase/GTPase
MGKLTRLALGNFTCFEKLDLEFSNGVNVLIGVNGTGKTHILKVLYAACAITVGEGRKRTFLDKLLSVFSPYAGNITRLCRSPIHFQDAPDYFPAPSEADFEQAQLHIGIKTDTGDKPLTFSLFMPSMPGKAYESETFKAELEGVYIPVKEMLAHAPGFISLNSKREIAFEEVYVDIIMQAYLPKLKELPNTVYEKVFKELTKEIGGEVILKGEHFFLKTKQAEFEFSLLAEGVRKLALIWLLIQNGSLNPGSILFWDEPEANLNPSLIGLVVETLLELHRQGVQIFLTTHNYVLLKEFDLRKEKDDAIRYISLFRDDSDSVVSVSSDTYTGISHNAISDTFSDLYQRDIARALRKN